MAKRILIKASKRTELGTVRVNKIRAAGRVPAVLYRKNSNTPLEINGRELVDALNSVRGQFAIVDLELDGNNGSAEKRLALIHEIQQDPLTDKVLHVDFEEIVETQKIHAHVNLIEVGECIGVKMGGTLSQLLRKLHVECLPKEVPASIDVDVSHLEPGKAIHVSDIKLPSGVVALNPPSLTVFAVTELKAAKDAVAEEPKAAAPAGKAAPAAKAAAKPAAKAAAKEAPAKK